MTNTTRHEDPATPGVDEFNGFTESNSSETLHADTDATQATYTTPNINEALAALLESNRLMQTTLSQKTGTRKVYVPMPEQFNGKVGDFIEAWLEQFETWFRHRERVEGNINEHTKIETAIQNTKHEISLDLTHHERDYGEWMTWEAFATHMKDSYGSTESGLTRFIRLGLTTQGSNESVNAYYSCFRCTLGRQKKRMKHVDDNHIYYYMFIVGLDKETNAEVLRLPESLRIEEMEFHEVLELAKCAEQTVKARSDTCKNSTNHSHKKKNKHMHQNGDKSDKPNGKMSHEKLTPKEKTFLTSNINRGGGLVINEGLRNKFGWIKWATKIGVCRKCAGKGHRMAECTAGEVKPSEKLNAMDDHVPDKNVDSGMDIDSEY